MLKKQFNRRYDGTPVTAQAISGWLTPGMAGLVGIDPHELLFGKGSGVGRSNRRARGRR